MLRLRHIEVFALQPVPQPLAPHRSPKLPRLFAVELEQILHAPDPLLVQPNLCSRPDPRQIAQRELPQRFRQNVQRQRHQPIRLFHVTGHLGQVPIRRQPHRTAQHRSHALADPRLHPPAQLHRRQQASFASHQPAGHLVDREHRRHRQARFHGLHNAAVVVDINLVPRLHQHQVGAHPLRLAHLGPRLDPEGLGLVTGGNANSGIGHHGDDAYRPSAQLRPDLLLHRSKVGVQIDKKPIESRFGSRMRPSGALCIVWHRFSSPIRSRFALKTLIHQRAGQRIGGSRHLAIIFAFYSLRGK